MVFPQIRLGEWDVHTDTEFHPNLEMDILSVRLVAVSSFFGNSEYMKLSCSLSSVLTFQLSS